MRERRGVSRLCLGVIAVLLAVVPARAQVGAGALTGIVSDQSGGAYFLRSVGLEPKPLCLLEVLDRDAGSAKRHALCLLQFAAAVVPTVVFLRRIRLRQGDPVSSGSKMLRAVPAKMAVPYLHFEMTLRRCQYPSTIVTMPR